MASVARHRTPGQEADELSHGRKVDPLLPERLKDQNAEPGLSELFDRCVLGQLTIADADGESF